MRYRRMDRPMQSPDPDIHTGWLAGLKLAVAWVGYWISKIISNVNMQDVVQFSILVFTCLQIYVLWRDKIRNKP